MCQNDISSSLAMQVADNSWNYDLIIAHFDLLCYLYLYKWQRMVAKDFVSITARVHSTQLCLVWWRLFIWYGFHTIPLGWALLQEFPVNLLHIAPYDLLRQWRSRRNNSMGSIRSLVRANFPRFSSILWFSKGHWFFHWNLKSSMILDLRYSL